VQRWLLMKIISYTKPNWQRPKQALRTAGVSESTLYRWMTTGVVETMKLGGVRYVDVSRWRPVKEVAS
jgi:predicted site-specific integrase-resolvase